MAHLDRILVYPIKSLDGLFVDGADLVTNGGLEWDRRYAILDEEGRYVNGKREPSIHRIQTRFDLERGTVTVGERTSGKSAGHRSGAGQTFHLDVDRRSIEEWLTDFFGYSVEIVREDDGGFPDDTNESGPTVVATATLETVADWFDGIDADEMRRRLRANLEIGGVEPFWEDRLYDEPGGVVPFDVGQIRLTGVSPCQRCVVPTRDPGTGEVTEGFRETFVERREATLPTWANDAWFDHYFRLMVNTRAPESSWGSRIEVGDGVSVFDPVSTPE